MKLASVLDLWIRDEKSTILKESLRSAYVEYVCTSDFSFLADKIKKVLNAKFTPKRAFTRN